MRSSPSALSPSRLIGVLVVIVGLVVPAPGLQPPSLGAQELDTQDLDTETFDPIQEFESFCLAPDGNLEWVEDRAPAHGYAPAQDRVAGFRPLGNTSHGTYTYVWSRQVDGRDVQLMARPNAFLRSGPLDARFNMCSVAVRGENRTRIRNRLADHLGQDSFRQKGASVFAWTLDGDDRRPIRRKTFESRGAIVLFIEDGMRMVTVAANGDQVILTYFAPGRDCRALSLYTPDHPNIYCDRVDDPRPRRRR